MGKGDKKVVTVGAKLTKFIGAKATREKKLQAASMQAEFTLHDTLIILCYLAKDPDAEIASQARKNLIPAARGWYGRPDRPQLPEPIYEIVMKVIEKIGAGRQEEANTGVEKVTGNIGLLGLGEIIQAVDHNNRTVTVTLRQDNTTAVVYTRSGKVIGAVCGNDDGIEALHTAFSWGDAPFEYVHSDPGSFRNPIKINTLNLVMGGLDYAPEDDPFYTDTAEAWEVDGHLKLMNVFEIAEIFEMNSKQTVCRLTREGAEGELFFKNGRIVNAQLHDLTGMDAACHLLAWPSAGFKIIKGGEGVEELIHVGMQNLIIEAMRLLDEGEIGDEQIAAEIAVINELFEGRDLVTLPILEKVRLIFSEDQAAREALETDPNPLVRKAVKVKISKTVHKYLNPATDHSVRVKAAQGVAPLSTTEKLVLLSYLSHDESQEIRDNAKRTLESLDVTTYRRGFGADLHPSVMDFLVRETIRDESLIRMAASSPSVLEETAAYILRNWKGHDLYDAFLQNRKLLERCPGVSNLLAQVASNEPDIVERVTAFENSMLEGFGDIKVEGPLAFFGLSGLLHAARQGLRSGVIVLENAASSGRIDFGKGRFIGARWDTHLEGRAAIEAILAAESLRFRYVRRTFGQLNNLDPVEIETLIDSSLSASAKEEDSSQAGFRIATGSLAAMDLFEVLTSLEGCAVNMTVSVVCEEGMGEIYRDRSRILHAHVDGKAGPYEAMASLMSWTGLRFIVRPLYHDFPVTVDKSLTDFFTECVKLVPDEITRSTRPGELPEWELSEEEFQSLYHQILNMGVAEKIKLALTGSKEARTMLIRDSNKLVAVAVIKSPKIQEQEIEAISKSRQVSDEVLRTIAASKDWLKSYSIKLNLVGNSKTPVPIAMRLLPHILEPDLRKLAKSKNVPSMIASQARRLVEAKSGSR